MGMFSGAAKAFGIRKVAQAFSGRRRRPMRTPTTGTRGRRGGGILGRLLGGRRRGL